MATQRSVAMGSFSSVVVGTAVNVSDGEVLHAYVSGTFAGTIVIEASADGTNFAPVAAGLTAPGIVVVPVTARSIRANMTAFTSGTAVVHGGVEDEDRKD